MTLIGNDEKRLSFVGSQVREIQLDPSSSHYRAEVPPDDGSAVVFKWHWPRGTFDKRMSALEICLFIMPHMGAILRCGLLSDHPRVQAEFQAMAVALSSSPKAALDRLLSWIKPLIGVEEDDIIYMQIGCLAPQSSGPTYFT